MNHPQLAWWQDCRVQLPSVSWWVSHTGLQRNQFYTRKPFQTFPLPFNNHLFICLLFECWKVCVCLCLCCVFSIRRISFILSDLCHELTLFTNTTRQPDDFTFVDTTARYSTDRYLLTLFVVGLPVPGGKRCVFALFVVGLPLSGGKRRMFVGIASWRASSAVAASTQYVAGQAEGSTNNWLLVSLFLVFWSEAEGPAILK